jgi:hypothetical protein
VSTEHIFTKYKCHKEVEAAQIKDIVMVVGGHYLLVFNDTHSMEADADWMLRHKAKVGDYVVQYEDGYLSVSPAEAFEKGYTAL